MQVNGINRSKTQPQNLGRGIEQKTPKTITKAAKTEKLTQADIKNVKATATSTPKAPSKAAPKDSNSLEKMMKPILAALDSLMKMIGSLLGKMESTQSNTIKPLAIKSDAEIPEAESKVIDDSQNIDSVAVSLNEQTDAESVTNKPSTSAIEIGDEITEITGQEDGDEAIDTRASKTAVASDKAKTTQASTMSLQALTDDKGAISVFTDDGFTIKAEGKDQAWLIIGPEGKSTRIWGDPHVYESDADKWDFKDRSSFVFGKNKVTVETVPFGNGETVTSNITVYNGSERVTISGIDQNKAVLKAVSRDGVTHDASLADGTYYDRGVNSRGESWSTTVNGKKDVQGN